MSQIDHTSQAHPSNFEYGAVSAHQLNSTDSDPDYNITLTAENLPGMRQAIQNPAPTSMDFDVSPELKSPDPYYKQAQKPTFFLENNFNAYQPSPQAPTTIHKTKHVFTVESTKNTVAYNNSNYAPNLQQYHPQIGSVGGSVTPDPQPNEMSFFSVSCQSSQSISGLQQNQMAVMSKSQSYPYVMNAQQVYGLQPQHFQDSQVQLEQQQQQQMQQHQMQQHQIQHQMQQQREYLN